MPSAREKLQQLLRELFQFGSADLDFGIYRIMNFKRDAIERFIKEDLIEAVDKELSSGMLASQSQAALELKEVAAQIRGTLGETALNGDDSLEEAYHGTPLGKHYLELQARASQAQERPAFEATIFNHLYNFFSRYYDNGDFLSKRRYSRREKYAVPYNGEEVYLHWANNDQYYVKTGEYFNDYRFKSPYGISIHFMLVVADVEKDNIKGDKRFFVPVPKEVTFDTETKEITIPFQYRPLTEQEDIKYGQRNQQDAIIKEALNTIPAELEKDIDALPALLSTHHTTADGQISFLEHHLRRYTRRNTSDFFVHKDLKGFLTRELDFYLKNEVLNLDEMEAAGESRSETWFQIIHVIKSIGSRVVEFLAQIENFQKRLFEKRKFILETQYCITMANVPKDFYAEIATCETQWQEWKELFHLDKEQPNLFTSATKTRKERRINAIKEHPTLVLDTKHFDQQFKDRLLASYENLDEITNGLLIHGENFQALNLLLEKYREKVKCIYIDPPFNTGTDEFLYKDGYFHSSWLAMMESRVQVAQRLLAEDGTFYAHIDYTEKERLKLLLDKYLSYITEIIWRIGWVSGYKSAAEKFIRNHDTIYQYGKSDSPLFIKTYIPYPEGYTRRDGSLPSGEGYPLEDTWNCNDMDQLHSIQIMSFSKEKVGNQALTQKNENLVARMVVCSSRSGDMIMDYFLGSGTTSAVAHKMGRSYIGIEMGESFFLFTLPRMKRVLYGDPYGISSDVGWKGGGIFKYIRLESYEDALNNITFPDVPKTLYDFDDYLLKYMLSWETKENETQLNVEKLASPFSYKLTITSGEETQQKPVDIPETFAYLLGLNIKTRRVYHDEERYYLVYRGNIDHREIVVIWRETSGWEKVDYERDKQFVEEQKLTEGGDEVFVNGDSYIPEARALESVFKNRMFGSL
ncbi:DNA methyltransferase [Chloroflexota bacterium]